MNHLSDEVKLEQVLDPSAAGTTNTTTTAVDMQGYRGVLLFVDIGTIATSGVVKVTMEGSPTSAGTYKKIGGSDAEVAYAAADDNKRVVFDLFDPPYLFVRMKLAKSGGNSTVLGVHAIRYGATVQPPGKPSDELGRVKMVRANVLS